jgi:hypothetical protein
MSEILISAAVLALLGGLCVRQYRVELEDERRAAAQLAAETRRHEAFFARMDTAQTDGETCDLCGSVSRVREMVDLADDVVLLCLGCAPMLRRRAQEAA